MSNNLGCGCNCNGNGNGTGGNGYLSMGGLPIQQGDTFGLKFQYKEDDTPMDLPEGYDMLVAIYDLMSKPIKVGRVSDGSILTNLPADETETKTYTLPITHTESMTMMGRVEIEVTIYNANKTVVDSARQIVTLTFEPRRNISLL